MSRKNANNDHRKNVIDSADRMRKAVNGTFGVADTCVRENGRYAEHDHNGRVD